MKDEKPRYFDRNLLRTYPLSSRPSKVNIDQFAKPPGPNPSFAEFMDGLPDILCGRRLKEAVLSVRRARREGKMVLFGMGAHAIKCGLNPILIDGMKINEPVYFSNESLARVEKFEGGGRELMCPRCKKRIEDNASVVRCPNPKCMVLHHEESDLNCWTYSPTCAMCSQPTDLDAGFQWVPDESCG